MERKQQKSRKKQILPPEKQTIRKEKKRKYLNMYCTNNRKSKNGELDAIIGRDNEIARVIQILSRRTKKQSLSNR